MPACGAGARGSLDEMFQCDDSIDSSKESHLERGDGTWINAQGSSCPAPFCIALAVIAEVQIRLHLQSLKKQSGFSVGAAQPRPKRRIRERSASTHHELSLCD
jgi:hypothetical protein